MESKYLGSGFENFALENKKKEDITKWLICFMLSQELDFFNSNGI